VPQYTKTLKQILTFLHIMYSVLYTCRRNNRVCKWKPTGHVDFISDRMGLNITELLTHNIEIDCKHECATRRDKCLHPTLSLQSQTQTTTLNKTQQLNNK